MRIIHFSDFHLNGNHLDRAQTIIRRMIESLKIIQSATPIDLVIFSGDLIEKGGEGFPSIQHAFKAFEEIVITPIVKVLNIDYNRFIFTIGNHDVNTSLINREEDERDKQSGAFSSNAALYRYMCEKQNQTIPQISDYNRFRDSYWDKYKGDAMVHKSVFQYCVKLEISGMMVGIDCLNTAWRYHEDSNELVLGKLQIIDERDFLSDCELKFSIGHHHPSLMNEFETETIQELIACNFDAFFCGHTHSANEMHVDIPQGDCFYFTSAGALPINVGEEGQYKNGFLCINYDINQRVVEIQRYPQNVNGDFQMYEDYGDKGTWRVNIPGSSKIIPIDLSLLKQAKNSAFMANDTIREHISKLRDKSIDTIQMVGLSGLGKTRMLREAFDDEQEHKNYFYCENSNDDVIYDVNNILREKKGHDGLMIFDNCPNELFGRIVEARNNYNPAFRIIGVNNDYYERKNMDGLNVCSIFLKPDDMRNMVNDYIDDNIQNSGGNPMAASIKKIADGFPGMAILLVDEYRKERNINIHVVDYFVEKLLKLGNGQEFEEEMNVLCTLALFQPFPIGKREAYKFIRENKNITAIYKKEPREIRNIFNIVLFKFRDLLDIQGSWLTVRPFPLAIWLVTKWFEHADEECMEDIVNDIQKLESSLQEIIRDGLCKRIEYMQDSPQAQELIQRLTIGDNAPFCNEKVICSDLGSRLFLAMSSVNPGPVATCLRNVLLPKQIDFIRENIYGNQRRNLVWTLEKLCFSKESYKDAVIVMALFAVAENEEIANNATGQLKQLFHILLPGTEASLKDRFETILYLKNLGDSYENLTLECIDSAFNCRSFHKIDSGSRFGLINKKDYQPEKKEIICYWESCRNLLIRWLDTNPRILEDVAKISENHVISWIYSGMLERMFPLLQKISDMKDNKWEEIYNTLYMVDQSQMQIYSKEFIEKFEDFRSLNMPKTFCQKLKNIRFYLYNKFRMSTKDTIEYEKEQYSILAKEFIDKKVYSSYEEIREIVLDKEYIDVWFSNKLTEIMNANQLGKLLDIFLLLIDEYGKNNFRSGFAYRICYVFREEEVTRGFIQRIYDRGYKELYVRLLSYCETESLLSYQRLKKDINDGRLHEKAISDYLSYVSYSDISHVALILKTYYKDFSHNAIPLMGFITMFQYDKELLEDKETLDVIKKITLEYPIANTQQNLNYNYTQYVKNLLERYPDNSYADKLNKKMIDAFSKEYLHCNFSDIYSELLKDYRDVIWDDFEKAFVSDNPKFYLQVKNEIGSGFGFDMGQLFISNDDRIKNMCKKYPDKAPYLIAELIPIFDNEGNEKRFSDWFIWLLDEFGDDKNVLSGLHANMGSFTWTGSIIPLLMKKKICFDKIKNHNRPEVRIWVEECMKEIDKELEREDDMETYMRLRYE